MSDRSNFFQFVIIQFARLSHAIIMSYFAFILLNGSGNYSLSELHEKILSVLLFYIAFPFFGLCILYELLNFRSFNLTNKYKPLGLKTTFYTLFIFSAMVITFIITK